MAGSQFLYLPVHYIEPSSPVFGARNTGSEQRGEKVDVKIVYLSRDLSAVLIGFIIGSYTETVDVTWSGLSS